MSKVFNRKVIALLVVAVLLFVGIAIFAISNNVKAEVRAQEDAVYISGDALSFLRDLANLNELPGGEGFDTVELAASPGPDRFNPVECTENVCKSWTQRRFFDASTTAFAIQNPHRATATLSYFSVDIIGGSTSTLAFEFATGTTAFATTAASVVRVTPISRTILATTTNATYYGPSLQTNTMTSAVVIAPDEWLVMMIDEGGGNDNGGFLGNSNAFDGWVGIELTRTLTR